MNDNLLSSVHYDLIQVQAHRVHNVQGGEFRALIVSTVRTCLEESQDEGFLNDPKVQ